MHRLRPLLAFVFAWLLPPVIAAHALWHGRELMAAGSLVVLLVNVALQCRRWLPLRFPRRERAPLRIPVERADG